MKNHIIERFHWNLYSICLIALFIFLPLLRWQFSPSFLDIYYHLSVVLGFNEAGGFPAKAFWEFAPIGRPHIYPPLLHILMLIFYKLGVPILTIARFFEFIIFPVLVIVIWSFVKSLFNERLAFFTLLVTTSIYAFFLATINFIPASLALILGTLSILFIEKEKFLAAAIFLSLSFYAHTGITLFLLVSLIIYGILYKQRFNNIIKVVSLSVILSLPLLIHQYANREYLYFRQTLEKFPLEVNPWLFILAIGGFFITLKKKKEYYIFLSLVIASLFSLLSFYKYRFLSGQGIIGFIFLSGLSLDYLWNKLVNLISDRRNVKIYSCILFCSILIFFMIFSPTFLSKPSSREISLRSKEIAANNWKAMLINSTYINIFPNIASSQRANELSIYFPKYWNKIIEIIKNNSNDDDIIYCNLNYVGGLLSVLSKRATSSAMLKEIRPYKEFDPLAVSKLIIWIKDPERDVKKEIEFLIEKYKFKEIAETDLAYIYENPKAQDKKEITKPIISNRTMFILLFFFVGAIILDINRKAY